MQSRSLPEQFPFRSTDLVLRTLRALTSAIESRLQDIEVVNTTYAGEVAKFEALGITAINNALTPLVEQAIERLTDVAEVFEASSPTSVTIGTGAKQFIIPGEERLTFVATPWLAIYSESTPDVGMIARLVDFTPTTGELNVDVVYIDGTGTYDDWTVRVSAPPAGGATLVQVNSIVDALAALVPEMARDAVGAAIVNDAISEVVLSFSDVEDELKAILKDNSVANARLVNRAGPAVMGRAASASGPVDDIVASTNDTLLRRVANELAFGAITLGMIPNGLITAQKLSFPVETGGQIAGFNTRTGHYTAALSDAGLMIEMDVASANNLTIPPSSSVAFPIKTYINVSQVGQGQTTLVPGAGVTLRSRYGLKLSGQWSVASLFKRNTDEWIVGGDLVA